METTIVGDRCEHTRRGEGGILYEWKWLVELQKIHNKQNSEKLCVDDKWVLHFYWPEEEETTASEWRITTVLPNLNSHNVKLSGNLDKVH